MTRMALARHTSWRSNGVIEWHFWLKLHVPNFQRAVSRDVGEAKRGKVDAHTIGCQSSSVYSMHEPMSALAGLIQYRLTGMPHSPVLEERQALSCCLPRNAVDFCNVAVLCFDRHSTHIANLQCCCSEQDWPFEWARWIEIYWNGWWFKVLQHFEQHWQTDWWHFAPNPPAEWLCVDLHCWSFAQIPRLISCLCSVWHCWYWSSATSPVLVNTAGRMQTSKIANAFLSKRQVCVTASQANKDCVQIWISHYAYCSPSASLISAAMCEIIQNPNMKRRNTNVERQVVSVGFSKQDIKIFIQFQALFPFDKVWKCECGIITKAKLPNIDIWPWCKTMVLDDSSRHKAKDCKSAIVPDRSISLSALDNL